MTRTHLNWQNIRHYIWLIGAVLCLVAAFIFWAVTDVRELVIEEDPIEEVQVQIQPEKVAATTNLGSLENAVRPLEMTTRVVASGNHDPEFRGTKFLQANQKNWSIELFRVTEEEVIKNFLLQQPDRNKFVYFRLSGENQAEQYVLGYGLFSNEVQVNTALSQLNIKLPVSVKPAPIQFSQYIALVNDMGSEELAINKELYEVKLKPAALPIIDETILAQVKSGLAAIGAGTTTTKTTVTTKDEQGNVVDVQRSQSTVKPPLENKPKESTTSNNEKKASNHEVTDPFN